MSSPVSSPTESSRLISESEAVKAAEPVKVAESRSNGRKWAFFTAALICGAIAAVSIVGLAALMVPQVTAAVGLSAGALMITNLSLAVVGAVAFLGAALFLAWGAKPQASAKVQSEEKPAEEDELNLDNLIGICALEQMANDIALTETASSALLT